MRCECDYCQRCGNEIEIYDLCTSCYEGEHFNIIHPEQEFTRSNSK